MLASGVIFLLHFLYVENLMMGIEIQYFLFIIASPFVFFGEELINLCRKYPFILNMIGAIILLIILFTTIF